MFFYLLERAKEYVQNKYSVEAVSALAYLILYSYVPKDLKFYFWALFAVDVTITYYKKIIFDKIDEWYSDKNIEKDDKVVRSPVSARSKARQDEDIKTNKSGYFESALDQEESISESAFRHKRKETDNSSSTSTDLLIDKMIKDSKSF
ncbi:hypothetical protein EB001_15700 [bacterium]|nr:hypothetical protein [bacterium]